MQLPSFVRAVFHKGTAAQTQPIGFESLNWRLSDLDRWHPGIGPALRSSNSRFTAFSPGCASPTQIIIRLVTVVPKTDDLNSSV